MKHDVYNLCVCVRECVLISNILSLWRNIRTVKSYQKVFSSEKISSTADKFILTLINLIHTIKYIIWVNSMTAITCVWVGGMFLRP